MDKIMLIIMSVINVEAVIDRTFALAEKNDSDILITFFREEKVPSALKSFMRNTGYLGEKVQEDVKDTIREEFNIRINDLKEKIKKKSIGKHFNVITEVIAGDSIKECYAIIDKKDINYCIINYTRDKFRSQVSRRHCDDLIEDIDYETEIYIDGQKKNR